MQRFDLSEIKINQIMTKDLITIHPEDTVEEAVKKMVERDVERLPVISNEQILIGLITFRDVVTKFLYQSAAKKEMKVAEMALKASLVLFRVSSSASSAHFISFTVPLKLQIRQFEVAYFFYFSA
jgi:CBS domain-containing protein